MHRDHRPSNPLENGSMSTCSEAIKTWRIPRFIDLSNLYISSGSDRFLRVSYCRFPPNPRTPFVALNSQTLFRGYARCSHSWSWGKARAGTLTGQPCERSSRQTSSSTISYITHRIHWYVYYFPPIGRKPCIVSDLVK